MIFKKATYLVTDFQCIPQSILFLYQTLVAPLHHLGHFYTLKWQHQSMANGFSKSKRDLYLIATQSSIFIFIFIYRNLVISKCNSR
ncbi:hypothetical protein BGZ60DRAFT_150653 [Tricladium varicosporioides]|nr:hypothetical protein BGZ60DRAFT_150653 [Hymenoscyphus varicosporioides]